MKVKSRADRAAKKPTKPAQRKVANRTATAKSGARVTLKKPVAPKRLDGKKPVNGKPSGSPRALPAGKAVATAKSIKQADRAKPADRTKEADRAKRSEERRVG